VFKGVINKALEVLKQVELILNFENREMVYHYHRRLAQANYLKKEYKIYIANVDKCLDLIDSGKVNDNPDDFYLFLAYSYLQLKDYENAQRYAQAGIEKCRDKTAITLLERVKTEIESSKK